MRPSQSPLAAAGLLGFGSAPLSLAASTCNGYSELCDRKYSSVTFVGSHNSAFVGILPVHNQYTSPTEQLDMGVRYLQSQSHDEGGTIEMCHTDCDLLDAGTLEQYLQEVTDWVKGHENDVVSLLITNGDGIDVAKYADVFEKTGLDEFVYTPNGTVAYDDWPTLGELIADGTRVVVFMDYNANTDSVPYILDQFAYYFEGPFDTTDPDFAQCAIDRPGKDTSPDGRMYLVNHYLDIELPFDIFIPDQINAPMTNSLDSILQQAELCDDTYSRMPNVILLDWIYIGDAMSAQEVVNEL